MHVPGAVIARKTLKCVPTCYPSAHGMLAAGQQRATSVAATDALDRPGDEQSAAPANTPGMTPGAALTEMTPCTKAREVFREYREKYGDQQAMDLLKSFNRSQC